MASFELKLGERKNGRDEEKQVQEPMFVGALVSQLGVPAVASISGVLVSYAISLLPWCAKYDEWPILIRTCVCGTGWEIEPHSNDLMSNGLVLGVTVGEFHEIVSGVPGQAKNATTMTEVHDHTVQKMLSLGLLPFLHFVFNMSSWLMHVQSFGWFASWGALALGFMMPLVHIGVTAILVSELGAKQTYFYRLDFCAWLVCCGLFVGFLEPMRKKSIHYLKEKKARKKAKQLAKERMRSHRLEAPTGPSTRARGANLGGGGDSKDEQWELELNSRPRRRKRKLKHRRAPVMMFGLVVFSTFFAEYLMPPVFWRFRDVKLFNWEFMSFPVLYCVVIHPSLKVNVDTAFRLCYMDCVKLRARGTRMVTFWYFFSSAAMAMHLRNTMALMQNADSQIFVIIAVALIEIIGRSSAVWRRRINYIIFKIDIREEWGAVLDSLTYKAVIDSSVEISAIIMQGFAGYYSAKYPKVFLTGNRNFAYNNVVLALTVEIMVFLVSSYFERMEKLDLEKYWKKLTATMITNEIVLIIFAQLAALSSVAAGPDAPSIFAPTGDLGNDDPTLVVVVVLVLCILSGIGCVAVTFIREQNKKIVDDGKIRRGISLDSVHDGDHELGTSTTRRKMSYSIMYQVSAMSGRTDFTSSSSRRVSRGSSLRMSRPAVDDGSGKTWIGVAEVLGEDNGILGAFCCPCYLLYQCCTQRSSRPFDEPMTSGATEKCADDSPATQGGSSQAENGRSTRKVVPSVDTEKIAEAFEGDLAKEPRTPNTPNTRKSVPTTPSSVVPIISLSKAIE
eukprot:CAMPEP_0119465562 /NCGR_PEP_ID=MMETSP1344-20130328/632_1 /TAXON_ID=236787 /ORGANISM="Florenciella parvula, Strain CCMP2471" /LENGTH=786 /DNA_ID=CAMNT_0007497829 /DNA_START=141 /DNA_END=2498 /DNA_ORIENTATION=+